MQSVRFVFVSACHSASAGAAFVAAGVPHVIAIETQYEVEDEAARVFARVLYQALFVSRHTEAPHTWMTKQHAYGTGAA